MIIQRSWCLMRVNVMEVSDTIIFGSKTWFYSPKYSKLESSCSDCCRQGYFCPIKVWWGSFRSLRGCRRGGVVTRNWFVSPSLMAAATVWWIKYQNDIQIPHLVSGVKNQAGAPLRFSYFFCSCHFPLCFCCLHIWKAWNRNPKRPHWVLLNKW